MTARGWGRALQGLLSGCLQGGGCFKLLLEGVLLLLLKHLTSPFLKLVSPPLAFSHTSGTASLPPSAAPTRNPAARTSGACRSPAREAAV